MKKIFVLFFILYFQTALSQINKKCHSLDKMGDMIFNDLNESRPNLVVNKIVKIAVIDTGIDFNNEQLKKRIWVPSGFINKNNFGLNFVENNKMPQDRQGHGTHVSGIILALFPQAKIFPIKYYDEKLKGAQNLKNLINGLRAAIDAKVDIINISGGGPVPDLEELALIKEAKKKNILIVSAAGNEGYLLSDKQTYYPAQYGENNIISVLNLNQEGFRHHSSNYGKEVEIGALGTIYSYGLTKCISKMVGTSQSTAVVSALAAMIKAQYPSLTVESLKNKILESTKLSKSGYYSASFSKLKLISNKKIVSENKISDIIKKTKGYFFQ